MLALLDKYVDGVRHYLHLQIGKPMSKDLVSAPEIALDNLHSELAAALRSQGGKASSNDDLPPWGDPRVQTVYEMLCSDMRPDNSDEHWEGFVSRQIVGALCPSHARENLRQDGLADYTVSCSGLEVTIQCNDHDVKDRIVSFFETAAFPREERRIPANDCRDPSSCDRHNECMYLGCSAFSSTEQRGDHG
jgi:hypothetical protein